MEFQEFKDDILSKMADRPKWSRKGQFVFNYIEETYGDVARYVQFIEHIDCFYNDEKIDSFIDACYKALKKYDKI